MLSAMFICYADCRYAECHYTECHYTECGGAPTKTMMNGNKTFEWKEATSSAVKYY